MTVALALILVGALMIYCGVKGKSLRHALVGKGIESSSGSLLEGSK